MTAHQQLSIDDALDDVSSPIDGDTKATVELVGDDWRADEDWRRFEAACRAVAAREVSRTRYEAHESWFAGDVREYVNPNEVRAYLTNDHGLIIEPRRYSAFWHRASKGKDAFLVADGWVENTDRKSGNAGKPLRRYRLREAA